MAVVDAEFIQVLGETVSTLNVGNWPNLHSVDWLLLGAGVTDLHWCVELAEYPLLQAPGILLVAKGAHL